MGISATFLFVGGGESLTLLTASYTISQSVFWNKSLEKSWGVKLWEEWKAFLKVGTDPIEEMLFKPGIKALMSEPLYL